MGGADPAWEQEVTPNSLPLPCSPSISCNEGSQNALGLKRPGRTSNSNPPAMDREPLSRGMMFQRMGSRLDIVPQRHRAGAPGHSCRKQNHSRDLMEIHARVEQHRAKPTCNSDYNYQALRGWDTKFPLPGQAAGVVHSRAGTGERSAAGEGGAQAGC